VAQANHDRAIRHDPPWWLTALGILGVLASIFILGVGFGQGWGASQWGPLSAWLSSGLTFVAVVVALRQAAIAQRHAVVAQSQAVDNLRSRLVDYELARRRENLKSLDSLWSGIEKLALFLVDFVFFLRSLPETFDPAITSDDDSSGPPLLTEIYKKLREFSTLWIEAVDGPLFITQALLQDTGFEIPLAQLNVKLNEVRTALSEIVLVTMDEGCRPDVGPFWEMWEDVIRQRPVHLELASQHFSLTLADVERFLDQPAFRRTRPA
jgi:hypothetical protein